MELLKTRPQSSRALLVQVICGNYNRRDAADSLAELERLAHTAGISVLGSITQRREKPDAGFFAGKGKLEEIQLACKQAEADMLIFDNALSPVQVNNLAVSIGAGVMDRIELIFQIFAERARTSEAQIQVELARLQYLVSRVTVLEEQQRFKGGVGMKGPGESPFQIRRGPMLKRIAILKKKLKEIKKHRRRTRAKRPWPVVCLVGYTNAGKSTLLNALSPAGAYVDDLLFATLDTKSRLVYLAEGKKAMLTDTVGFIRNLPHGLVASFHSTLEEITEADLLLIVAETNHPYVREHLKVVDDVLNEINAVNVPRIIVFNKIDVPGAQTALKDLLVDFPDAYPVSALRKQGLAELTRRLIDLWPKGRQ